MSFIINNNKDIKFTDNIDALTDRQNLSIKFKENPNCKEYISIIDKIDALNSKNIELLKNIDFTKFYYNNNIFNSKLLLSFSYYFNTFSNLFLFIIVLVIFFMYKEDNMFYALYNNTVNSLVKICGSSSILVYFIVIFLLLKFSICVKNSLETWYIYYKNKNNITAIKSNLIDMMYLSKVIIMKRLTKNKNIIKAVNNTISLLENMTFVNFLVFVNSEKNEDLNLVYEYINYVSTFLKLNELGQEIYYPTFWEKDALQISAPSSKYTMLSSNCMVLDKKYPLTKSIIMAQTFGQSLIDGLSFTPFRNIVTVFDIDSYDNTSVGNLIIVENNSLEMDVSKILTKTSSDNYFILLI